MTTSTSFAQMTNNQSISLLSALRANTPPTKGQTTSRKFLTLSIFFLLSFFCTTNLWGAVTTYTFTSKSWEDSSNGWTSGKDGNALTSNQGVQVTTGVTGANATTKNSFTNISSITVRYCTNSSKGKGSISIQVGSNTAKTFSVSAPGSNGTTLKTQTFTFNPNETGKVKISVTCSTNSIYIYSVAITTADAASCTEPTVGTTLQSVSATENSIIATIPISSVGGCNITENGLVYSTTNSTPTVGGSGCSKVTTTACGSTAANKTVTITGLNCGTSYYIRGYATNEAGTSYTNVTTKSTSDCPKYTVTLVPGSGSVADTELEEESAGAGVTLPTPTLSSACQLEGWSFAGWTTSSVANETSSKPATLLTGTYKPTSNITLYAVYKRIEETEGTPTITTTTDKLTRTTTGITGTSYSSWSGKTSNSDAVYAGQSAGGNEAIQLRSNNNNSGVITTASGGKAKKVTVVWNSNTADGRTLDIYGKNSAYSAATDLYSTSTQGTKLGSIAKGSTTLTITGDYEYIGLRSNSGAMYLTSISIDWTTTTGGGSTTTTYYHSTPDCVPTCTDPALAYATATITKTVGDAAFTNPLTNDKNVSVTYTSTNTNVATVDIIGQVTIKAVGETTIKATWDGSTDHCADEASYTLKINPKTYTITVANNISNGSISADKSSAVEGATIKLTAKPNTGYKLDTWNVKDASNNSVSVNANGEFTMPASNVTVSATFVAIPQLDTPTNLSATDVTTTAATLTWDWIDNENSQYLNGYNLYYKKVGDANFTGPITCNSKSSTRNGLTPNTEYVFKVAATSNNINECKSSEQSAEFTFKTKDLTQLAKPTNLPVTNITCTEATLSWDAVTNKKNYKLTYTDGVSTKEVTTGSESVTLNNLLSGTTYTWEIQAIGDGTNYANSEVADGGSFTTNYKITYNVKSGTWTACEDGCVANGYDFTICSTTPTKTGYNFMGWSTADDTEAEYQAGGTINNVSANTTLYAVWEQKTYTITWVANGQEFHKQEDATHGTNLAVPSAPDPETYACDDKVFVGWTATQIDGSTDTEPADLFTTKNINVEDAATTYYAVFATAEGDGGAPVETTTTLDFSAQGYENGELVTSLTQGDVTITLDKGSNSNDTKYYTTGTAVRVYGGGYFTVSVPSGSTISSITLTFGSGDGSNGITVITGSYTSGTTSGTWTGSASSVKFSVGGSSGHRRIQTVTVTYATTTQGGGTSYSDYTTVCEAIPDPVWGGAVINRNSIKVDCGSMTKLNAADPNGPATISFPAATNHTLTYDITVTASEGFFVSTNKTDAAKYGASVTVSPNKTGDNAGKITQNVYVVAVAPAMSDEDFTGTITLSGKQLAENQVIDVTADVTCTTYALTFNDRGNKPVENYYAGVEVPQPVDPTGVCTDPIHYEFDGWATSTVAGGSTTYTKVSFPYTMPAKATTLYAVYRYTEGNTDSDKFMSVDKEIGELVNGMDYVLTGYNTDDKEYALSCTQYESGKYKTKQIDVSESTTMYDEENPYYELTTTDNEIIWTITGDDENGYSFQNKSTGKYLNMEESSLVLNDNNPTKYTIEHYVGYDSELGEYVQYLDVIIQPSDDASNYLSSYYKNSTAGVLFNLHSSSTLQLYLYKRAAATLYTTSPACGPMLEITSGKDIYVTSGFGTGRNTVIAQQTVEYRATRLKTQNGSAEGTAPDVKVAANGVTMGGVVTDKVKVVELTQNKELIGDKYTITGTVTVQYTPTANNLQEEIQVQLAVDYNSEAKDNFTVHARSLPAEFVIAAKQGEQWYALNADMSGNDAEKANGYLQVNDIEDPTKATFAPCNTIYTFDGMVDGGNKEYMRFQGIDGKYLWAASAGNTGIQNYAKNTPTAGTIAYNWQLYTSDNETYQLQNEGNGRKLGLNKDLSFGMYSPVSALQQDIRILPYEAKCLYNYAPTNLKVSVLKGTYVTLTWDAVAGATKYQYRTDDTNWTDCGTEPTVTINGLEGETKYIYYIRAYHEDDGVSQECIDYAEITFTTANCDDVPADITYSADLTSITVTWTAVSTNCTVRLYSDEACTSVVKFADELKGSVTFSQLDRNTTYYVRVFAEGTCASPIVPVKTEDVELDIVEWDKDEIYVDINTNEKVSVTLENEVSYGSGSGQKADELFFSKYFEGSGSLKMIAIYNGTGKDVNLSEYRIDRGGNGDATDISKTYDLSQLGVIKQGQEIIFYSWPLTSEDSYSCSQAFLDSKAKESGLDANPRWILCDAKTHSGIEFEAMDFSGDDPLLFYKGNTLIDVFGVSTEAERPSSKEICSGRSDYCWSATGVSNMDYGKTTEDFPNGEIPYGVNVDDETITAYTARVIMFRKNTVVSGKNAVTKNTTTFATFADEWEARQVCRSGDDGDLTCAAYQELGTFDYSKYYTKFESMGDDLVFDTNSRNSDGTITVPISGLNQQSCRNIKITVKDANGNVLKSQDYKVPIMITSDQGTDGQAFLNLQENLATVEVDGSGNPTGNKTNLTLEQVREICKTCDVVVRDNATLTKVTDGTTNDHPQVRNVYVYEGASIVIPDGDNHNYTINGLSLRRKGDVVASAQVQGTGKFVLPADEPVCLDLRVDANNWHWFTLPFDCLIEDVTWVDGTPAKYNTDWFLMYYDGESRAASTNPYDNHWKVYNGTTIEAGKGYIVGITGDLTHPNYTFELRFPMAQDVLTAEQTRKTVPVNAWGVKSDNKPNNLGWNLVGNPYLNYYKTADEYSLAGLPLIKYTSSDLVVGEFYEEENGNIPFLVTPIDGGWYEYRQELASEVNMMPFTAYFVQVGDPNTHTNGQALNASFEASNRGKKSIVRRAPREVEEIEEPIIVRVELTNSKGESDKTSLVIDDRFTNEYEMNGDFFKWFGDYYNYYTKPVLYTIGADQGKRAFNALNEELAKQPIPVGMYAAQAGNYTFSLNQQFDLSRVEEVWLHDATQSTYTNLMQSDYTFSTSKVNGAGRFSLSVKLAPKVATGMDNVTADKVWATTHTRQVIINGLENGMHLWLYDATGKLLYNEPTSNYQHTYAVPQTGTYFVSVMNGNQKQTIKVVVE